jgi:hypothetical protein
MISNLFRPTFLNSFWGRLALTIVVLSAIRIYATSGLAWNGPVLCAFRGITGQPCPLCGTTRSIASATLGDFNQAISENILGLTTSVVLISIFLLPNLGKQIGTNVETIRNKVGNSLFSALVTLIFMALWTWNFTRWT